MSGLLNLVGGAFAPIGRVVLIAVKLLYEALRQTKDSLARATKNTPKILGIWQKQWKKLKRRKIEPVSHLRSVWGAVMAARSGSKISRFWRLVFESRFIRNLIGAGVV